MEIIKIINDINNSIKVLDISNSVTIDSLPVYLDSIKYNKLSMLVVQKNKQNNEVFEMMESMTDNHSNYLIYFLDEYVTCQTAFEPSKIRMMIKRMIESEGNLTCGICLMSPLSDHKHIPCIPCSTCGNSFCKPCVWKMLEYTKNINIKCPICNTYGFKLTIDVL